MISLFWHPRTRAARIVWLLEEAGLEYDLVNIDIREPKAKRPAEFGFASPMGKIPAIRDGSTYLAESSAIALYIADRYKDAGLGPDIDDVARGRFLYWMFFTPSVMEPAMLERFGLLQASRGSHGHGDWASCVKTLEAGLASGDWLMLETFSAADVMVGSTVHFWDSFNIMPDSDPIKAYLERCRARPAFQRMLAIEEQGKAD